MCTWHCFLNWHIESVSLCDMVHLSLKSLNCFLCKIQVFLKNDYKNLPLRLLFFFSHFWVLRVGSQHFSPCSRTGMLTGTAWCQGVSTKLFNLLHAFHKISPMKSPLTFPARPQRARASGDEQGVQSCGLWGTWAPPWKTHNCRGHRVDPWGTNGMKISLHSLVMSTRLSPQYTPNSKLLLF